MRHFLGSKSPIHMMGMECAVVNMADFALVVFGIVYLMGRLSRKAEWADLQAQRTAMTF